MKIFIIMVFNNSEASIHQKISNAITETGNIFENNIEISLPATNLDVYISKVNSSDLVIVDVSQQHPHVMFSLGVVQTCRKPVILLTSNEGIQLLPFLYIHKISYDRIKLKETLYEPLRDFLLTNSNKDLINKLYNERVKNQRTLKTVFISYSHSDPKYFNRLMIHLKPFHKQEKIEVWADTSIKVGEKWKEVIAEALARAAVAILLIDADFLASDFIMDNELPPLLKSAKDNGTFIVPVMVKPCFIKFHETLSSMQIINDGLSKPLSNLNENDCEEIYVRIATQVSDYLL